MEVKGDHSENDSLEWMEFKSPGCQGGRQEKDTNQVWGVWQEKEKGEEMLTIDPLSLKQMAVLLI